MIRSRHHPRRSPAGRGRGRGKRLYTLNHQPRAKDVVKTGKARPEPYGLDTRSKTGIAPNKGADLIYNYQLSIKKFPAEIGGDSYLIALFPEARGIDTI